MSDGHEQPEPAAFAERSRELDPDRRPDHQDQPAAPDPGCARPLVIGSRTAPPMGRNTLVLLIAVLAVLVAVGILSG
jgi:hypothetical protein